jgi:hypothetical protein
MKLIQKYFQDKREMFDDQLPPAGHALRFKQKLKRQKQLQMWSRVSAVAAVLIVVAVSVFILTDRTAPDFDVSTCSLNVPDQLPENIKMADTYFDREVREKSLQVLNSFSLANTTGKMQYLKSIHEYQNHRCKLYRKLEDYPENPRLHNALLQQYQMTLHQQSRLLKLLNP